jgi:hypothetical protein
MTLSPRILVLLRDAVLVGLGAVASHVGLIGPVLALMAVSGLGGWIAGILALLMVAAVITDRSLIRTGQAVPRLSAAPTDAAPRPAQVERGWPVTAITLGACGTVVFLWVTAEGFA